MPDAAVEIVSYDPQWRASFERERACLEPLLTAWQHGPIEHIGSTAVVGLSAKPVIDLMIGVRSLEHSEPAKEALGRVGYLYADYRSDVMHWFCKPSVARRTHHVHLIPFESRLWLARLVFRDRLRGDARLAAEYMALKLELAARFRFEREAYTEGKSVFITRVLRDAS